MDFLGPESMPKLAMSKLSPSSSASNSAMPTPRFVSLGVQDGLSEDEAVEFNLVDREQRRELVQRTVTLSRSLTSPVATLLPLLEQVCEYDDCALPIAQLIPELMDSLNAESSPTLERILNLSYILCCHPNPVVTQAITESLRWMFTTRVSHETVEDVLGPFVAALVRLPWSAPRSVGASLLVELSRFATTAEQMESYRRLFMDCCKDDDVLVKQGACRSLHHWIRAVEPHEITNFPLPLVNYFLTDELHDALHIELVKELVEIGEIIGKRMSTKYLQSTIFLLCRHRSWRVRYTVASNVAAFLTLLVKAEDLVPEMMLLARDEEVEVVAKVVQEFDVASQFVPTAVLEEHFVPLVLDVLATRAQHVRVRSAIATTAYALAIACPSKLSDIVDVILQLALDVVESVQLNAIGSLVNLFPVLTKHNAAMRKTQQLLMEVGASTKWRLREAVAIQLKHFASAVSKATFEVLLPTLRALLFDSVAQVRTVAVATLAMTAQQYDAQWATALILALFQSELCERQLQTHVRRVAAVRILEVLLPSASQLAVADEQRPALERIASTVIQTFGDDIVPNVRRALALALSSLKTAHTTVAVKERHEVFRKLSNDKDMDVQKAIANTVTDAPF